MRTTIDPDNFRISPEEIRAAEKSLMTKAVGRKPKGEIQFYLFPKSVLEELVHCNSKTALLIALAVYKAWYCDFKKRNPVKLTSALLAEFRISKDQKFRALKILSKMPQFLVEHSNGRNPLITMKWKLIKD
jgi:hypothetical protein